MAIFGDIAQRCRDYTLEHDMSRWYYWVSGFFLLDAMMAFHFINSLVYGHWLGKPGDKFTQCLFQLLILTSLTLFVHGYRRRRSVGTGGGLAFAAIAFLFLTTLWSMDPGATAKEAVVYFFVVVGAIGIANTMNGDEFMELLSVACFLAAVASVVLLVISPSNALMPGSTEFQGIFSHKNYLGQVMATGALATLHGIRAGGGRRVRKLFMLFVFAGVAIASTSATSCFAIFAFCCVDGIIALYRTRGAAHWFGVFLAIALLPTLVVVAVAPDSILEMIGKDSTLTGRTEIWAYVMKDISIKPLLGWGYFAFWLVQNPAALEIADAVRWFVPQAHNGLLEMLLNIGLVGTAIFVFLLIRNLVLAFRCLRTRANALAISSMMSCAGILMVGVSESVLLAPTQSSTSVFFITGFMCEQAVQAAKRRRQHYRITPRGDPLGLPAKLILRNWRAVT